jgi:hypothetical protein
LSAAAESLSGGMVRLERASSMSTMGAPASAPCGRGPHAPSAMDAMDAMEKTSVTVVTATIQPRAQRMPRKATLTSPASA